MAKPAIKVAKTLPAKESLSLDQLFLDHYAYCVQKLQQEFVAGKYYCSTADAKDIVMDAFLKLQRRMEKGPVEDQNMRAYLLTICRHLWLQGRAQNRSYLLFDLKTAEYFLGKQQGLYGEQFNPLLKAERAKKMSRKEQEEITVFKQAWQKLGLRCQRLLEAFYLERRKLKDLRIEMGYGSYDSIKSMRRKCFNKLLRWKDIYLERFRESGSPF